MVKKKGMTQMNGLTIFGGKGFIGKHYVDQYYHHAIGNIASVNERSDYQTHSADVLYLISTVDNYNVFTDVHVDIDTNLTTLMKVLESWKHYQTATGQKGVFNFISSWSVYGDQKNLPVAEDAQCNPKGFYIITKHCAEQLLRSYCETFGLKYRILRLANIIGPGDSKVSYKKNTLQNAFDKLRRNQDVELFGDGMFYRDFMHVDDCAAAIETVIAKGAENEIYNIGNGNYKIDPYCFILTYAQAYLESTGTLKYVIPTHFQSKTPVGSFYMDVTKLRGLGFVPKYLGADLYKAVLNG